MTDYADLSMSGIREDFYREVPADAQARLIGAFPELRLLWNPVIHRFQIVHREPGYKQSMYGTEGVGVLLGWQIVGGNFPKPLDIEDILRQLRLRVQLGEEQVAAKGFKSIAEYADHLAEIEVQKRALAYQARHYDFWGINPDTERVGVFHPLQTRSRPYGVTPNHMRERDLPVAPAALDRAAFHVKPMGAKEQAKRARRMDRALREGTPL